MYGSFENMFKFAALAPMLAWAVLFFGGSAVLAANAVALKTNPRRR